MTQGSKYTEDDLERGFIALMESGGNCAAASRACDIPASTLRGWKNNHFHGNFVELRREERSSLIDEVWKAAEEAVKEIRKKIPKMKTAELLRAFSMMADKGLLIGGEPSKRIDITSGDRPLPEGYDAMSDDELREALADGSQERAGGEEPGA